MLKYRIDYVMSTIMYVRIQVKRHVKRRANGEVMWKHRVWGNVSDNYARPSVFAISYDILTSVNFGSLR
jgi:hypothetical protein